MSDKKIIIIALILSALLIAAGWYFSKYNPQGAAILPTGDPKLESGIVIGNPDAPVIMEEYTNFLCSHCKNFANNTLPELEEKYINTGKVKLVLYVYPLELGQASLCAVEQNKFMAYHDYLFTHNLASEADIKNFAVNAGLNEQEFNSCYDSKKYEAKSQKWLSEGEARGVDGTPTFFINGKKIIGAQPYQEFENAIEEALKK